MQEVKHVPPEEPEEDLMFSVMMFGIGLALLFPWNTMLRTIAYLRVRLQGSSFEGNFANYLTTSFTISNTFSMGLLVLGRTDEYMLKSSSKRIIVGLVLNAVWLLVASFGPVVDFVGWKMSGDSYFVMLLVTVLLMGASTALLQKGVYGYTAGLPVRYTPLMLLGQGSAGLLATLLSFGLFKPTPLIAAGFFWGGVLVVLTGLGLFLHCSRKYQEGPTKRISFKQVRDGFQGISFYALSILLVMMVTLSLFPSVMAMVKPNSANSSYASIFLQLGYLTFDLGDIAGKFMPNLSALAFGPDHLMTKGLALVRFAFYPIFFVCNISGFAQTFALPDYAYFLMLFLFALTNGYANALLLMNAPVMAARKLHVNGGGENDDPRARAGTIMGLFINLGLASGSLLSFACRAFLCRCNPFKN